MRGLAETVRTTCRAIRLTTDPIVADRTWVTHAFRPDVTLLKHVDDFIWSKHIRLYAYELISISLLVTEREVDIFE